MHRSTLISALAIILLCASTTFAQSPTITKILDTTTLKMRRAVDNLETVHDRIVSNLEKKFDDLKASDAAPAAFFRAATTARTEAQRQTFRIQRQIFNLAVSTNRRLRPAPNANELFNIINTAYSEQDGRVTTRLNEVFRDIDTLVERAQIR